MRARRPLVPTLVAGVLLLTLSGCERPTPGVTIVSGTETARADATTFCFGGPEKDCVQDGSTENVGVLRVQEGEQIGVDVDRDLADSGWYLVDVDLKSRSAVQDRHYFAYTPSFQDRPQAGIINLEVRSTERVAEDARTTGLWRFQLVQE